MQVDVPYFVCVAVSEAFFSVSVGYFGWAGWGECGIVLGGWGLVRVGGKIFWVGGVRGGRCPV